MRWGVVTRCVLLHLEQDCGAEPWAGATVLELGWVSALLGNQLQVWTSHLHVVKQLHAKAFSADSFMTDEDFQTSSSEPEAFSRE